MGSWGGVLLFLNFFLRFLRFFFLCVLLRFFLCLFLCFFLGFDLLAVEGEVEAHGGAVDEGHGAVLIHGQVADALLVGGGGIVL